jgi:hypothetical protein
MAVIFEIKSKSFVEIIKLENDVKFEKLYNEQNDKCLIFINLWWNMLEISEIYPDTNILLFDEYDKPFELMGKYSNDVISIGYHWGAGSKEYELFTDKILCQFQNLTSINAREADIISVNNDKLLFYSDANYNYQKDNPDLCCDVCDTSMKLEFEKINFNSIECATVMVRGLIKDNYYYSLEWINKMTNLKRLNLILSLDENVKDVEKFINEMNVVSTIQELVISSSVPIDLSLLKISTGVIQYQSSESY